MMIADLVDVEDFCSRLMMLGVLTDASGDIEIVEQAVFVWMDQASEFERENLRSSLKTLTVDAAGLMLPDVVKVCERILHTLENE